jgi:serine/threonine-protein kinase
MTAAADRHLLFGLLALQNGIINQGQLLAAFQAWTLDKSKSLADHLEARGDLASAHRAVLEALAGVHLDAHGGDMEKSLAVVSVGKAVREGLALIGAPEINATLGHLGSAHGSPGDEGQVESDRTASYSDAVGTATSDGQRFRVLRPHARRGLGAAFVALDEELHREVALKQMLDDHADDPASRQRFILEAEVTGGLEHPGIVPVYGLGCHADGRPYYAMRFIRGDSLKAAVDRFHSDPALESDPGRRSLELRKLLRRFTDVCNAIAYAHSRGVLHRDIKPGNIILGKHGETLVVDWGLAKATGRVEPGSESGERTLRPSSTSGSSETLPGSALGTPAYMSPEQAEGDLDHLGSRSDVYSLGATLYYVLTGRPPFAGDAVDVIPAVRKGDFRPPSQVDPSIDRALEAICKKAMAHQPVDRYATPKAMTEDLERWMADEPVSAWREPPAVRSRRWMRRHRTAVTAAAALLLATVVALAIGTIALGRAEERTRTQRDEARRQRALAEENFRLARRAVDEYFTQVSENTLLNSPVPGMQPVRKELLHTALRYYRQFQARHRDDLSLRAELARACYRIGQINSDIGTSEEALAAFEEARTLGEALVREHPGDLAIRSDLVESARKAGILLARRMGRSAEGLERLERALALSDSLVRDRPDELEFQRELAACYADLSSGHSDRRLAPAHLPLLEKALAIESRPARIEPSYRHQYEEARTLYAIGHHYSTTGHAAEALAHFDRASEILARLHHERAGDLDAAAELARTWLNIGRVHRSRTHRIEAALDAYRQARRIFEELARDNPAVIHLRTDRDGADFAIGDMLSTAGRFAEAAAVLRPAIEDGERIVAADPAATTMRYELADAEISMGKALRGLGRTAEALVPLARGRDLLKALRQSDPDNLGPLINHARCIRFLGAAQAELARREAAIQTLSDAIRILEATSEDDRSRNFLIVANLAVVDGDLGELQYKAGRLADAEQTLVKAEELGRTYNGQGGRQRLDPLWLVPGRTSLGLVWRDMGKKSEAREVLQKAGATLQALSATDADRLISGAAIDSALAELAGPGPEREAYDRKAAEYFRRAIAIAERHHLTVMAKEPDFARLRARPDLVVLLWDRLFPADPFAR